MPGGTGQALASGWGVVGEDGGGGQWRAKGSRRRPCGAQRWEALALWGQAPCPGPSRRAWRLPAQPETGLPPSPVEGSFSRCSQKASALTALVILCWE